MEKIKWGIRDLVGLFVSGFFLWLTLRDFSFGGVHLNGRTALFLAVSVLFVVVPIFINAHRFRLFFRDDAVEYRRIKTFPSFCIGNFYNSILPGNLGEIVKLYYLEKKYGIPRKRLVANWVTEKFLGALVLPFLFMGPLLLVDNAFVRIALGSLMALIVLAAVYVYGAQKKRRIRQLPFRLMPFAKARRYLFGVFVMVFSTLADWAKNGRIYTFFGLSVVYFTGILCYIYCIVEASGLPPVFASPVSVALLGIMALVAGFIPSLPSSAGVLHYGIYASFLILADYHGITVDTELNDKFVMGSAFFHGSLFFTELALGLPFVWNERKLLFRKKTETKETVPA